MNPLNKRQVGKRPADSTSQIPFPKLGEACVDRGNDFGCMDRYHPFPEAEKPRSVVRFLNRCYGDGGIGRLHG